ncbi:MAG: DUF47 family protein [Desulfobacterales bacterium]|nr:DUF47 family protein [Desulfobacterales bacterium]
MLSNIFSKILPPKNKIFFDYFEESAQVCSDSAKLFFDIAHHGLNEDRIIQAKTYKHKSNNISKQTITTLNSTFITPIDREDIQVVDAQLNRINKKIINACYNLKAYRIDTFTDSIKKQSETLVKATDELKHIVGLLKKVNQVKEITESNYRMKEIESHGDEILYRAMENLFSGEYDALSVLKLRDIYKDIERALDTCFTISDSIVNIVLKEN